MTEDQDYLEVIVGEGRYDCYGPITERSKFLMKELEKLGGISDTVAPGVYHFNIIENQLGTFATLLPAPR